MRHTQKRQPGTGLSEYTRAILRRVQTPTDDGFGTVSRIDGLWSLRDQVQDLQSEMIRQKLLGDIT